jgi:hypothetical protein
VRKKSAILLVLLFLTSLFLTGCVNSSNAEAKSKNLVCAFVEGYLENKAFALIELAEGGSAEESVDYYLSPLSNEFNTDIDSKELFSDFAEAMLSWGSSVDLAQMQNNSAAITNAALELEIEMDKIEIKCEEFGWKFKKDWRL